MAVEEFERRGIFLGKPGSWRVQLDVPWLHDVEVVFVRWSILDCRSPHEWTVIRNPRNWSGGERPRPLCSNAPGFLGLRNVSSWFVKSRQNRKLPTRRQLHLSSLVERISSPGLLILWVCTLKTFCVGVFTVPEELLPAVVLLH